MSDNAILSGEIHRSAPKNVSSVLPKTVRRTKKVTKLPKLQRSEELFPSDDDTENNAPNLNTSHPKHNGDQKAGQSDAHGDDIHRRVTNSGSSDNPRQHSGDDRVQPHSARPGHSWSPNIGIS